MGSTELKTEIEDRDGVRVIRVAGPLDSVTQEAFRAFLDTLLKPGRVRIVLDCSALTYVNSTGLTLLARARRTALQGLSFFGIAALNARILKAIELLGMGHLVKPYATVEDAVRAAAAL